MKLNNNDINIELLLKCTKYKDLFALNRHIHENKTVLQKKAYILI